MNSSCPRPTLLLIDAQEKTRWLFARSIKGGYDVYPTADLGQATGYLSAFRPDVILSDRKLDGCREPGIDLPEPILLAIEEEGSARFIYLLNPELPPWRVGELVTHISYFAETCRHFPGVFPGSPGRSARTDRNPAPEQA